MVFSQIASIVTATLALYTGILALSRIRKKRHYFEHSALFLFMTTTAFWALNPFLYDFMPQLIWLSAALEIFIGIMYLITITDRKFLKTAVPVAGISLLSILFLILFPSTAEHRLFPFFMLISVLPGCGIFIFLLFSFYRKSLSFLHVSMAIGSVLMAVSGIADTIFFILEIGPVWFNIYASLFLVIVIDFNVINRGYLAIHSWKDYSEERQRSEALLRKQNELLKAANSQSVTVLSQTIEAKDPYTRGHCLRVRDYSKAVAKELKMHEHDILNLEYGAVLHDVGKLVIPGIILNKPGPLDHEEFMVIKDHPETGARIIRSIEMFRPVIPMVRHHHEHFDGGGYPDGLKSIEIPLAARILAVADAYDAMTSDRPYRKALSIEQSLAILRDLAGTQLDPEIVLIFIESGAYTTPHNIKDRIAL